MRIDFKIDIAYNYKFGMPQFSPEEKITDYIGYLYFRYDLPAKD